MTVANCVALASGPISVPASSGLPSTIAPRALGDQRDELVVDVLVRDQPGAGHARLPAGGEDAGHDAVRGGLEVGVGEDELRRLAAELERDAREVARRALGDVDARPRSSR